MITWLLLGVLVAAQKGAAQGCRLSNLKGEGWASGIAGGGGELASHWAIPL